MGASDIAAALLRVAQLWSVRPHHTLMEQTFSTQFGISWPLVILAAVILAIRATIVSARTFRGALAPLWNLLSWLLPSRCPRNKKPGRYETGPGFHRTGLLAIYLTWLQAGRLK